VRGILKQPDLGRGRRSLGSALGEQRVGSGSRRLVGHGGVHVQPERGPDGDVHGEGRGHAAQVGRAAAKQQRRRAVHPAAGHDRHDRAEVRHRLRPRRGQPPGGLHLRQGQEGPAVDLHRYLRGEFGLVKNSSGVEQITYEGLPLYVLKGAKPLLTTGNGQGGVWHVVKLSASDIG
jgi:hypothetical protein